MFKFIKKIFDSNRESRKLKRLNTRRSYICELSQKNENILIPNFSFKEFEIIFEYLIFNAFFEIIIFVNNYDSIFNKLNFILFEQVINRFEKQGKPVKIFTYYGKKDKEFIDLEKKYKCVEYIPLHLENNSKACNMILVDRKGYWLEESFTSMARYTMDESVPFKACANFCDTITVKKLNSFIIDIEEQIRGK